MLELRTSDTGRPCFSGFASVASGRSRLGLIKLIFDLLRLSSQLICLRLEVGLVLLWRGFLVTN